MELHEYTGEPTDQEIQQRLEFWNSWSPGAYKDDHLRIHPTCPCCDTSDDTEWVRNEWNICYHCMIAFECECYIDLSECDEPEEEEWT